ncbi:MAG: hypothetical protein A2504_11640 [Bdellovibrionales bacterium RIFOXYD12_FULL_39_22]|nr:MAG: hypothetical protein A2385_16155 [Bdellovibrionales bacterium RIFOXYB1_FULL_39_21]OFZ44509.1 MAG: hypothetical protein A2485_06740 [Bdellovibrionales bacterium RIFOXYC12_FULL_39_17]OFZ49849.1 MAG: hypothetical protein A2404_00725 [Bdellovibrionales bacterium RIFOXYC1_FULL_39_130]OFZ73008.1 MAG: hypothetical protein A2451_15960 [Bdellovibrionales bacterium RIFOXYC2_FULL_39_8]OFZ76854.1 MAG: hypothetical protein A2560_05525 [Bdellovibrionales bacterium RIFOXYD1_FULL_39_84]OFZ95781.1 MAG:
MHVTIVDDQPDILDLYEQMLGQHFRVTCICEPQKVSPFLKNNQTDLLILDVNMPVMDGFEVYRVVRVDFPTLPIIFLTGMNSTEIAVKGLSMGADDFIIKPVSIEELIARVKNKIIKSKVAYANQETLIKLDNFELNCNKQQVILDGREVSLTPIEFKIIHLFVSNRDKIFSRDFISDYIWNDTKVQMQNIDTHLSNVRKKLSPFSERIKTIKSRGYVFK